MLISDLAWRIAANIAKPPELFAKYRGGFAPVRSEGFSRIANRD